MTSRVEERSSLREWLIRKADQEDACEGVSAGGVAAELGASREINAGPPAVFGKFIELSRRARGWSIEQMAAAVKVDVCELIRIEQEQGFVPPARTVFKISETLGFNAEKLRELAGSTMEPGGLFEEAGLRFATQLAPLDPLSNEERLALEEFVKVLGASAHSG